MEIPDRVKQALSGESVQSAVNLGDEDLICFTPTRTLLYRGDGLLSDESIQEFSHDVERLDISEGRRKTSFSLEYVDAAESFSVSNKRTHQVLERLLAGVLDAAGVLEEEESVEGVYLFSELTVIITDRRLVKHIGTYVWDGDYEEYHFSDVTSLDFEEGSVATQIVLAVDGRPQRIKAPSDKAKKLRRTLTEALFSYYEVDSLEELNATVSPDTEEDSSSDDESGRLGLDDSISPLVDDDDDEDTSTDRSADAEATGTEASQSADADSSDPDDERKDVLSVGPRAGEDDDEPSESAPSETDRSESTEHASGGTPAVDPAEIEAMKQEIATLRTAVEEQNDEIEKQRETIEQLIEELRKYA